MGSGSAGIFLAYRGNQEEAQGYNEQVIPRCPEYLPAIQGSYANRRLHSGGAESSRSHQTERDLSVKAKKDCRKRPEKHLSGLFFRGNRSFSVEIA